MIENPRTIKGVFEATEENFIELCQSMISKTLKSISDTAELISGTAWGELFEIGDQMKFPMPDTVSEETADKIHKFLNDHKTDPEKIGQLARQLKTIYEMLQGYANATARKPPASPTPTPESEKSYAQSIPELIIKNWDGQVAQLLSPSSILANNQQKGIYCYYENP